jgi:hypothetical protein
MEKALVDSELKKLKDDPEAVKSLQVEIEITESTRSVLEHEIDSRTSSIAGEKKI